MINDATEEDAAPPRPVRGTHASGRLLRFGLTAVVLAALGTAALADFLFYRQYVGWTLGGFAAWLVLLLLIRHGRALMPRRRRIWGLVLVTAAVGLCVSLVIEPGVLAVVLALLTLGSLVLLARGGWPVGGLGWAWLARLFKAWGSSFIRPFLDSRIARRWRRRGSAVGGRVLAVMKLTWAVAGVVIPLVLSLIFIGLFAIANPVVADWLGRGYGRVSDFIFNVSDYLGPGRFVLWYLAAIAAWGLLRYRRRPTRLTRRAAPALQHQAQTEHSVHMAAARKREAGHEDPMIGPPTVGAGVEAAAQPNAGPLDLVQWVAGRYTNLIVRCLLAMNAVFAVQLVLDSRYLVLGSELPEGMTYAEYAHRGAYPLIVTALLAAAMVLAVFRSGGLAQRSAWARRLVLLWIAQNVVLVGSAAWRLAGYVEVYTLTRLRVAAAVWMLMVAGCLVLLLWRIARGSDNAWLTAWAMGWGLAVLLVCSFVPFDPMIARYNVLHCQELGGAAGPIDVGYLEHLGPDALPAVRLLLDRLPREVGDAPSGFQPHDDAIVELRSGVYIQRARTGYQPDSSHLPLRDRLAGVRDALSKDLDDQLAGWRGWTLRRAWLHETLPE